MLRFALVGCGTIAATHADALRALPDAELAVCCDSVDARAAAFASQYGCRAASFASVLTDPAIDAVTVCTPSGLHAHIGVQALVAGKHVIVEKPMDVSLEACDLLLHAAQTSGKTLSVVSQHRFDPATERVKAALDAGLLGQIVLADARVPWFRAQSYYDSGDWRGTFALDGGGALMNQGVHTADLLLYLCGPVRTVQAQTATLAHDRIEVEDAACAVVTFTSGAPGTLMATTAAWPGFAARLAVHGTRGTAIIEGDTLHTLAVMGADAVERDAPHAHALQVASGGTASATAEKGMGQTAASAGSQFVWGDAHRAQLADFVRCCRTGETPRMDGASARAAVELVLSVYQSARTGSAVELAPPTPQVWGRMFYKASCASHLSSRGLVKRATVSSASSPQTWGAGGAFV